LAETQNSIATNKEATMIRMSWGAGVVGRHGNQKEPDNEFIDQVLALWDKGCDTWGIHQVTGQAQAACERALHTGLEGRRKITWRKITNQDETQGEKGAQDGGSAV